MLLSSDTYEFIIGEIVYLFEKYEAEANFFAKYAAAPPPLVHQIRPNSPNDIACTFGLSYQASCYALDYYHKWLQYGGIAYKPHEIKLLEMFGLMEAI